MLTLCSAASALPASVIEVSVTFFIFIPSKKCFAVLRLISSELVTSLDTYEDANGSWRMSSCQKFLLLTSSQEYDAAAFIVSLALDILVCGLTVCEVGMQD